MHVLVMAKSPVAGQVKTRLCPPLEPEQAAQVALAALLDTLDAVAACGASRRVLALAGSPGPWLPSGFEIVAQRGDGFNQRLTNAWLDTGGSGLQIGMDTPQLTAAVLDDALDRLADRPGGSVLGPAHDGGWWAIGLHQPIADVFTGVPLSSPETGAAQFARLEQLGLNPSRLAVLRDVDDWDDAMCVADDAEGTRFARRVDEFRVGHANAPSGGRA